MTLIVYKYANNWTGVCTLKQYTDELVFDRNVKVLHKLQDAYVSELKINEDQNKSGELRIQFTKSKEGN